MHYVHTREDIKAENRGKKSRAGIAWTLKLPAIWYKICDAFSYSFFIHRSYNFSFFLFFFSCIELYRVC